MPRLIAVVLFALWAGFVSTALVDIQKSQLSLLGGVTSLLEDRKADLEQESDRLEEEFERLQKEQGNADLLRL